MLGATVVQHELVLLVQRHEVERAVTRAILRCRVARPLELVALQVVARVSEHRRAVGAGGAAAVVEVQVGQDHVGDAVRVVARRAQRLVGEQRVFQAVDRVLLVRPLVADAGVDQIRAIAALQEQEPHAEIDAILLVGRVRAGPERMGHDAEHRAPVEGEIAARNGVELELADRAHGGILHDVPEGKKEPEQTALSPRPSALSGEGSFR